MGEDGRINLGCENTKKLMEERCGNQSGMMRTVVEGKEKSIVQKNTSVVNYEKNNNNILGLD